MRVGILSCSSLKLPVRCPAKWMYSRSPRFSQFFQYLSGQVDQVFIISALYGWVHPKDVIDPYERKITDLDKDELRIIRRRVYEGMSSCGADKFLSILSQGYWKIIDRETFDISNLSLPLFDTGLGRFGSMDPLDWPIQRVMKWVAHPGGIRLEELKRRLESREYHPATVKLQIARAIRCPLHRSGNGLIWNRYL